MTTNAGTGEDRQGIHQQGATVKPSDRLLSIQEAADHLGYAKHTMARLLEGGDVPFTTVDGDKRILLRDLSSYEEASRRNRRDALAELSRDAVQDGSFFRMPSDMRTR